ncbi:MAG: GTPase Obg [Candidatus Micrarchaeota archaeon]|nr:MAG: GTPase Obg [Candidatus Micrarchaeota archaeon]
MSKEHVKKLAEKLKDLEERKKKIVKNKATEDGYYHIARLIAKTKEEIQRASRQGSTSYGFSVKKTGDKTVALVGFPSAGKSSLINVLTSVNSKTAEYAFTTTEVIPGMLIYKDAHIQILDLPGIIENAATGRGNGKAVLAAVRATDLICIVLDVNDYTKIDNILEELRRMHIYINKRKPDIKIEQKSSGGINITGKASVNKNEIIYILKSISIYNADVIINDPVDAEEFISIVYNNAKYVNAICALNKIDLNESYNEIADQISKRYNIEVIPISVMKDINIDKLKEAIFRNLNIIRVYTRSKLEDEPTPMILDKGSTVYDAAKKIHSELAREMRYAYITGRSVKFSMQKVSPQHVLEDGDIITIVR